MRRPLPVILTTAQRDLLRAWAQHEAAEGIPPTLAQAAERLGGVSKVTVLERAQRLAERGLLERTRRGRRAHRLTVAGRQAAYQGGWQPDPLARLQAAWADAPGDVRARFGAGVLAVLTGDPQAAPAFEAACEALGLSLPVVAAVARAQDEEG